MNLESLLLDIIAVNQNASRLKSIPEALGLIHQEEHRLTSACCQQSISMTRLIAMNLAAESIRLVAFLDSLKDGSPRDTIPAPPELP